VVRWKALLGDKNPEEAKTENAECLRALYGTDLIKNGFHGSDDERAANKERDIFLFPIPERPPAFEYITTKIPMEMI
jgi:nucleoside diphosphate kinase